MSFEYRSPNGVIRILQVRRQWRIEFGPDQTGNWPSAEAALGALRRRLSGIEALDLSRDLDVPADLLRWTPLADSL